jgi:AcrR family transcriptional regulator
MSGLAKIHGPAARNPERTRKRILFAALQEFAANGFAGARVDVIARNASINKRMLYHYFGSKEGLFRAVLRRKIGERQAWAETLSGDPADSLSFWFKAVCGDPGWIRLLEWESLQDGGRKVIDEEERQAAMVRGLERIRQQQAHGQVSVEFDPRHVLLAMRSLTMFPVAFPQLTRLTMGQPVSDPEFQRAYTGFLRKFAAVFQPSRANRVKTNLVK